LTWNTGAHRLLGWKEDEALGRPALMIWTPEDLAAGVPETEMRTAIADGRAEDERRHLRKDGSRFWGNGLLMPLRGGDGQLVGFLKILRDQTAQRKAEENRELLINELNHRVKNTLAVVQSIVSQTLRDTDVGSAVGEALQARILAVASAHDVLTEENWVSARLRDIVDRALGPYLSREGRFSIEGPDVRLSPKSALALAMVLHELATNAAKYGALSTQAGHVSVLWSTTGGGEQRRLLMRWTERGGPPVEPPSRRGFGTRLIERGFTGEVGGEARIDYEPAGVVCTIKVPLSEREMGALGWRQASQ
jgi:PAS domain S-box-containing protein